MLFRSSLTWCYLILRQICGRVQDSWQDDFWKRNWAIASICLQESFNILHVFCFISFWLPRCQAVPNAVLQDCPNRFGLWLAMPLWALDFAWFAWQLIIRIELWMGSRQFHGSWGILQICQSNAGVIGAFVLPRALFLVQLPAECQVSRPQWTIWSTIKHSAWIIVPTTYHLLTPPVSAHFCIFSQSQVCGHNSWNILRLIYNICKHVKLGLSTSKGGKEQVKIE